MQPRWWFWNWSNFRIILVKRIKQHQAIKRFPSAQWKAFLNSALSSTERKLTGEAKIDIWLPNTCGIRITDFDFAQYSLIEKPEQKHLILGDSIFQGISSYFPSCSVSNVLARNWDGDVINQSVGGAELRPEALEPLPVAVGHILVAGGINNAYSDDFDAMMNAIPPYFEKLRSIFPHAEISAVTPIWNTRMREEQSQRKVQLSSEIIRRECAKWDIRCIEGISLVPHHEAFFNEDGIHPNDLGFLSYSMNLLRQANI